MPLSPNPLGERLGEGAASLVVIRWISSQMASATPFCFLLVVLASIDLDGQLQLRAVEVERVLADRVLAPELHAKVPVAQDPPDSAFGVRGVPAQVTTKFSGATRTGTHGR